jgi:hypothetical protein
MDNAAAAIETANLKGLLSVTRISPASAPPVDKADVEFRGVLQDPEVLSPSTESLLRGPKRSFCGVEGAGRESTSGSCSTPRNIHIIGFVRGAGEISKPLGI